jgi:hypothetical protein
MLSPGDKVAEPSRLRRARCPRSFQGSKGRERGRPARMKGQQRDRQGMGREVLKFESSKVLKLGEVC